MAEAYTISPARYAKGKLDVRCPSTTGWKTRAARLAEAIARGRYTGRERAYIMGPRSAERFERLYAEGWDATVFSFELEPPRISIECVDIARDPRLTVPFSGFSLTGCDHS